MAGDARPEEDEKIEFRLVRLSEVLKMIEKGAILDGKTLTSVLLYARLTGKKSKKVSRNASCFSNTGSPHGPAISAGPSHFVEIFRVASNKPFWAFVVLAISVWDSPVARRDSPQDPRKAGACGSVQREGQVV